ncbi:hypothetical protein JCM10450v2_002268 [Rhodotorula kratochvilovae]
MAFPHPLSRSPLALLLHLVALASLSWAFQQLFLPGPMSDFMDQMPVGGRWQYLTILSLAASWLTFAFSLAHDLVPLALFSRLKTTLAILAVPVEGLVAALYWSLTLYDPSLLSPAVAPGESPLRLPLSLDLALHALPALFLWLDFLFFSPPFPARAHPALIAATATGAYCAWMEYCAKGNGRYPYPMLDTMPPLARLAFYAAQVPVLIALFGAANGVHRFVRGSGDAAPEAEGVRRAERKVGKAL